MQKPYEHFCTNAFETFEIYQFDFKVKKSNYIFIVIVIIFYRENVFFFQIYYQVFG